jgi:hypothetical protein
MNWCVRLEGGHQRHLLVCHRRHDHVVVGGVAKEGLDVVAHVVLLDVIGLLLRHDQANHVGLGLGGVVRQGHEVDGGAVRAQERTGH